MNSKMLIITIVFALLSMWLTFQPMITMAQPAGLNGGINTSGINITTAGTNMTGGGGGGINTSGINITTAGTNMTGGGGGGINTSGINITTAGTNMTGGGGGGI